jgi:hypothetical protein
MKTRTIAATKIIKYKSDQSAVLTRTDNIVTAFHGSIQLFEKVFNNNAEAKRFMAHTSSLS